MPYLGQSPSKGDENNFKILDDISSYTLTFDGSSASVVSAANDTITTLNHRFITGQRVTYNKGGGTVITGLSDGVYYIIKEDHHTIKLATSASNANSGTAVNITGVGAGASHTLNVAFDGINTKFKATHNNGTKANITRAAQLVISINGVIQQPHDSTAPSTGFGFDLDGVIVLSQAPAASDIFWSHVLTNNNVTFDVSDNKIDNFTGNGSTTTFNLSKTPANNDNILVTIDGVVQYPDDNTNTRAYTVVENVLTFTSAPASGTEIQVRHIGFAGSTSAPLTGFYGRTGNAVLKSTDNITVNDAAITGNATISGNLTVDGTTTTLDTTLMDVDRIEVLDNSTNVAVAITQSGTGDILNLYDGSTERFSVADGGVTSLKATGDYQGLLINGNICPTVRFATFNDTTPLWKVGLSGNTGDTFAISDGATSNDRLTVKATHTTINGYLNTGSIALDTKLYHTGDNNNFMEFFTDQQYYATNGLERMRIHDDYVVSIGATNIPGTSVPVRLRIHGTSANFVGPFGILEFKNREDSGNATASIRANRDGISGSNWSAGLSFHTNSGNPAAGDGNFKRMVITSTGNVGIGTEFPTTKLAVNGNITKLRSNGETQVSIQQDASANGQIVLNNNANVARTVLSSATNGVSYFAGAGIKVGIGLTNPSSTLQVTGTSIFTGGDMSLGTTSPNSYTNQRVLTINGTNYGRLDLEVGGTLRGSVWANSGGLGLDAGGNTIEMYTGSAQRVFINTSGQMGIGQNFTPVRQLDVKDATGANRIMNIRGTGTSGAFLAFLDANTTDDSKCRVGSVGGNDIGIRGDAHYFQNGGGTNRMVIDSSGRVSIGTTTVGYSTADDLTIATSGSTGITLRSGTSSEGTLYFADGTGGTAQYSGIIAYNHGDNSMRFATYDGTEKVRIESGGRVFIGNDQDSSPYAWNLGLQVTGTSTNAGLSIRRDQSGSGGALLMFVKTGGAKNGNTAPSDGDQIGGIYFNAADGTDVNNVAARISATVDGTPGSNDTPGRLTFSTTADGANSPTERLRIKSNGEVTIGTSNPTTLRYVGTGHPYNNNAYTVHGFSNIGLVGQYSSLNMPMDHSSATTAGNWWMLGRVHGTTNEWGLSSRPGNSNTLRRIWRVVNNSDNSGLLDYQSFHANNGFEALRIDSTGALRVNTTRTTATKLHVVGGTASGTAYDAAVFAGGQNSTSGSGVKLYLSGCENDPISRGVILESIMTDNANAHRFSILVGGSSAAPTERFRITPSGAHFYGNQTNLPNGIFGFRYDKTNDTDLSIENLNNSSVNNNAGIRLASNHGNIKLRYFNNGGFYLQNSSSSGYLHYFTNNISRFYIDSSGNVSINWQATPSTSNGGVGKRIGVKSNANNVIIGETESASNFGLILESRVTGRSGNARSSQIGLGNGLIDFYTAATGAGVTKKMNLLSSGQLQLENGTFSNNVDCIMGNGGTLTLGGQSSIIMRTQTNNVFELNYQGSIRHNSIGGSFSYFKGSSEYIFGSQYSSPPAGGVEADFQVHNNKSRATMSLNGYYNNAGSPFLQFVSSRSNTKGVLGTKSAQNDYHGDIRFMGDNGTNYNSLVNSAQILARQRSAISDGDTVCEGELTFSTGNATAGAVQSKLQITGSGKIKYGLHDSSMPHAVQARGFVLYPDNGGNNKTTIRVSGLVSGCFIFQMGYYNSSGQGEGGFACAVSGYMTHINQYTIDNIKAPYAHANSSISTINKQNSYFEFTITNSHSSYTGGGTIGIIGDQEMTITVTYHQ